MNAEITKAREQYNSNSITAQELTDIFLDNAPEEEVDRFISAPVFDRFGIVLGKSQEQLDDYWRLLTREK